LRCTVRHPDPPATLQALSGAHTSSAPPPSALWRREHNGLLTAFLDGLTDRCAQGDVTVHASVSTQFITGVIGTRSSVLGTKTLPDKLLVPYLTKKFPLLNGTPSFNFVRFEIVNGSIFFYLLPPKG
jgi:hypothetical protein